MYKDWDSPYFGRALKAGEVFRIISFGLYWVKDGRFTPHQGGALQAGQRLEDGGLITP